ncbi:hypothetical protein [Bradyrhizobium canariense]|uniref:hypothetical protein n=1 Tax=Bradyrhizobium canariense TaxID=255045 RepID=UPI001CA5F3F6|nr:hypothetical protein [Bradyrhizobium canariense]
MPIIATGPQLLARTGGAALKAPGQQRRTAGAVEQRLPPRNLGQGSANGGARIKGTFQLSQVCDDRFGVAAHYGAGRQRARTGAASKIKSMRTKTSMRFSRLAEHMSAIVVPIAQAMKIDRYFTILLKNEVGSAASHEVETFEAVLTRVRNATEDTHLNLAELSWRRVRSRCRRMIAGDRYSMRTSLKGWKYQR